MGGFGMLFYPQGELIIHRLQLCVFHSDCLNRVQAYSGLRLKLCHLSDTPLTLEGWSSPAHRLPRSRGGSRQAGDRLTSSDQQSRREWIPPPDRAVVVPEAVPLPTPLRETLPAWYCPGSSACDGGRAAVRAIQTGSVPIPVLSVPAPEERHQQYRSTIAIDKRVGDPHMKGLVSYRHSAACVRGTTHQWIPVPQPIHHHATARIEPGMASAS